MVKCLIRRACAVLAACCLLPAAAPGQERAPTQTPGEIATIDLLNRAQREASRDESQRRAREHAEYLAAQQVYEQELARLQRMQFEQEQQWRTESEAAQAAYQRFRAEYDVLIRLCREGDLASCDATFTMQGLTPPPRPETPYPATRGPRAR